MFFGKWTTFPPLPLLPYSTSLPPPSPSSLSPTLHPIRPSLAMALPPIHSSFSSPLYPCSLPRSQPCSHLPFHPHPFLLLLTPLPLFPPSLPALFPPSLPSPSLPPSHHPFTLVPSPAPSLVPTFPSIPIPSSFSSPLYPCSLPRSQPCSHLPFLPSPSFLPSLIVPVYLTTSLLCSCPPSSLSLSTSTTPSLPDLFWIKYINYLMFCLCFLQSLGCTLYAMCFHESPFDRAHQRGDSIALAVLGENIQIPDTSL